MNGPGCPKLTSVQKRILRGDLPCDVEISHCYNRVDAEGALKHQKTKSYWEGATKPDWEGGVAGQYNGKKLLFNKLPPPLDSGKDKIRVEDFLKETGYRINLIKINK